MKRFISLLILLCMFVSSAYAISADDLARQCETYAAEGDYTSAFSCYNLARMADPDVSVDPATMALVWLFNGYHDAARECAQSIVDKDPLSVDAWALLFSVATVAGDQETAATAQTNMHLLATMGADAPADMLPATAAESTVSDKNLGAMFDSGSVQLNICDTFLPGVEAAPFSISPDGQTGLYFGHPLGEAADSIIFLAKRGDVSSITAVVPAESRGVADSFGNRYQMLTAPNLLNCTSTPAIWSPDGRYVTLEAYQLTMVRAQFIVDPFVIDTHTGELILLETSSHKIKDGGAMFHAAFSADSSTLYYGYLGKNADYLYSIRCADLATGQTSHCFGMAKDYYPSSPALSVLDSGSLLHLEQPSQLSAYCGLSLLQQNSGEWTRVWHPFAMPMSKLISAELTYNAKSGYAVIRNRSHFSGETAHGQLSSILRLSIENDNIAGMDTIYFLKGNDTPAFTSMTMAEYDNLLSSDTAELNSFMADCWMISTVRLSPAGEYALVGGLNTSIGRHALLLVRMEDMACLTIQTPDLYQPGHFGTNLATGYRPGLEWNANGDIVTMNGMGNKPAITMQLQ